MFFFLIYYNPEQAEVKMMTMQFLFYYIQFHKRAQPRPQGFSFPTHFLREKPWGRGWKGRLKF